MVVITATFVITQCKASASTQVDVTKVVLLPPWKMGNDDINRNHFILLSVVGC